ncbi:MAG: hypothetical protein OD918_03780 [Gammaproteobacteria bacterium]
MTKDKQELLEIYKLHAELADRVSQRREGANRLYVSLLTGVLAFLAALLKYGTGAIPAPVFLAATGVLGCMLSVSWLIIVRSYRQLNTGKFAALNELEMKLAYPFFQREWEILKKGRSRMHYWELTSVEIFAPTIFLCLFLGILVTAVVLIWCPLK